MDTDFALKVMSCTNKIRFLKEYIIGFRVTPTSKTVAYWNDIRKKENEILRKRYLKYGWLKLFGIPLFLLYIFLFVLQGDLDYIVKRVFVEKRKKYYDYVK